MSGDRSLLEQALIDEGIALIQTAALYQLTIIGSADVVEVLDASIEKLTFLRDQLNKVQKPRKT